MIELKERESLVAEAFAEPDTTARRNSATISCQKPQRRSGLGSSGRPGSGEARRSGSDSRIMSGSLGWGLPGWGRGLGQGLGGSTLGSAANGKPMLGHALSWNPQTIIRYLLVYGILIAF